MTTASVAQSLRFALSRNADEYVEVEKIEQGLFLSLARVNGVLQLTLRREAVYPTEYEVARWAEAFGVPDGSDSATRHSWDSTHPKTQRPLRWCAVRLKWREDIG